MSNTFKVNNKDTIMTSGACTVNFQQILDFVLLLLLLNLNKQMPLEPEQPIKLVFSNCEKYIVLWAVEICWDTLFLFIQRKVAKE